MRWALLVVMAMACRESGGGDRTQQPPVTPAAPDPIAVDRPTADRGYVGVISAKDSTDVSSQLAGEITAVHVRIGDRVKAGDPIATVESRNINEQIAATQAALRSARAAVTQAGVDVEAAKSQLVIEEEAYAKGTSSKRDLTDARFRHRKALAALERARASQGEQQALLRTLRDRLGRTTITAPFAGTIALRHLDPGAAVAAGTPIVRLITSGELWVKFAVPGAAAADLEVGGEVSVSIEDLETTATATIQQIAPELEPNSQMIIVEAALAAEPALADRLQSGLVVRVR